MFGSNKTLLLLLLLLINLCLRVSSYGRSDMVVIDTTVISLVGSAPICSTAVTDSYIAENSRVSISCHVSYTNVGGITATLVWAESDCANVTDHLSLSTSASSTVDVLAKLPGLEHQCSCSPLFNAPANPGTGGYATNAPSLPIACQWSESTPVFCKQC